MDGQRNAGNELLAISHNANLSDGRMYPTEVDTKGRPIDAAYAESRDRNERLIEIKQLKVDSLTPVRVPAFEEVEPDVTTGWIEEQRARIRERAFEAMRMRYEVVLPKELPSLELSPLAGVAPP
jgi:hypothetical protein